MGSSYNRQVKFICYVNIEDKRHRRPEDHKSEDD